MNSVNHKQYLKIYQQAIIATQGTPLEVLKQEFAYDVERVVFHSKTSLTQFQTLFKENFKTVISYCKNTRVSALEFIEKLKRQDWVAEWTENERLAESFNYNECHEDFTEEAHEIIDSLFTEEAICDICNESEFENCYFIGS